MKNNVMTTKKSKVERIAWTIVSMILGTLVMAALIGTVTLIQDHLNWYCESDLVAWGIMIGIYLVGQIIQMAFYNIVTRD